jgi:hypothetical protein
MSLVQAIPLAAGPREVTRFNVDALAIVGPGFRLGDPSAPLTAAVVAASVAE